MEPDLSAIIEACMSQNHQYFKHLLSQTENTGLETASGVAALRKEFSGFTLEFKTLKTDLATFRTRVDNKKEDMAACDSRINRMETKILRIETDEIIFAWSA
ncbi:UNVERIFIED_CONTAM: hypothetical protein FKN15_046604 [Acipenser sinensis]